MLYTIKECADDLDVTVQYIHKLLKKHNELLEKEVEVNERGWKKVTQRGYDILKGIIIKDDDKPVNKLKGNKNSDEIIDLKIKNAELTIENRMLREELRKERMRVNRYIANSTLTIFERIKNLFSKEKETTHLIESESYSPTE